MSNEGQNDVDRYSSFTWVVVMYSCNNAFLVSEMKLWLYCTWNGGSCVPMISPISCQTYVHIDIFNVRISELSNSDHILTLLSHNCFLFVSLKNGSIQYDLYSEGKWNTIFILLHNSLANFFKNICTLKISLYCESFRSLNWFSPVL